MGPRVTVLFGRNGQGKSNFLEAAYYAITFRSFRTSSAADNGTGSPNAAIMLIVNAVSRSQPTAVRAILAVFNAEITEAENGEEALRLIKEQQFDVIFLDINMPGISGLELLRHLMQDDGTAGIPVVVVSADATTSRIQEALTLGAAHYVTKPLAVARFLRVIDETLAAIDSRWGR